MKRLQKSFCVFCGSRANSLEHVIAQRLFKRAGAINFEIVVGKTVDEEIIIKRKAHTLDNLKVRCVCRECNQGWMNELEGWFEERLGFLIEPTWPRLADTMIEALKAEKINLVRWMMKTAVTANENSVIDKIFPSDLTLKLKDGHIPKNLVVDLGYSRFRTVAFTFDQSFQVMNAGQFSVNQKHKSGSAFRFTVQFNHLLLRLMAIPAAKVTCWSRKGELPIGIYPQPARQNSPLFEYDSLLDFDRSVILQTDMRYSKAEMKNESRT